jgi:glycine cleavage system H protein
MANVRGFEFPDELHYLIEQDVWARRDPDGIVTIGMTELGCHISGDFVEFMPKPVGTAVERERAVAVLEMSKTVRSVRAPVRGTIVAVNEEVRRLPGLLNRDSYGAGWLVRLDPDDWTEDATHLAFGRAVAAAVARYMELYLIPEFGIDDRRTKK